MILRLTMLLFWLRAGSIAMVRADDSTALPDIITIAADTMVAETKTIVAETIGCDSKDVNVCFALDASSPDWFEFVYYATRLIPELYDATNGAGEYSAVEFATTAAIVSDLTDKHTIDNILYNLTYIGGGKNHIDALNKCQDTLISAQPGQPEKASIIILITDWFLTNLNGTQNPSCGSECIKRTTSVRDSITQTGTRILPMFRRPDFYDNDLVKNSVVEFVCKTGEQYRAVVCGRGYDCAEGDGNFDIVKMKSSHKVRCCRDCVHDGSCSSKWEQKCGDYAPEVYARSKKHGKCYVEDFCSAMDVCTNVFGGRLCTPEEVTESCAKGTGCRYDKEMVWACMYEGGGCLRDEECCSGKCGGEGVCLFAEPGMCS